MKKCLQCTKQFKSKRNTAKFCSDKCRVYFNRQGLVGNVITINVDYDKMIPTTIIQTDKKSSNIRPDISGMVIEHNPYGTGKTYNFCKHNAVKGMCKKGCK